MAKLASYAVLDEESKGRRHQEPLPLYRTEFQRDRDRIIHSSAFRRLEYKTQVFVNHEGDMFRTRLTHSIEVAQLGRSIARALHLNEELTEAIALAHDLGHTPFGHAGQEALNHCMKRFGGFEHNLQSLRVVDRLEDKYAEFPGLNLTYETREGILKHCSQENARNLGEIGQRFLNRSQPSLEAQLANVSDEIAYNNHDIDDGLRAGMLEIEQLCELPIFAERYDEVKAKYPDISMRCCIHEVIRRMINWQVTDLISSTTERLHKVGVTSVAEVREYADPLIGFSDGMTEKNRLLKQFLRKNLYSNYRVHRMSHKAQHVVKSLFEIFFDDPQLMPPDFQKSLKKCKTEEGEQGQARVVADYVAGMTDRFAIAEYERLFNPSYLT